MPFLYGYLIVCSFFVKDFRDQIRTKAANTQKKAEPGRTLP